MLITDWLELPVQTQSIDLKLDSKAQKLALQ